MRRTCRPAQVPKGGGGGDCYYVASAVATDSEPGTRGMPRNNFHSCGTTLYAVAIGRAFRRLPELSSAFRCRTTTPEKAYSGLRVGSRRVSLTKFAHGSAREEARARELYRYPSMQSVNVE